MPKGDIHILMMEDDAGLARLVRKSLEKAGYVVDHAPDGEQGLAMYETGKHDVIVLDHGMPGFSGLDVLRRLAARGRLPAVVMVTGAGNEEIAVEAMKLGADDYIVKDVDGGYLSLLPMVIERALQRRNAENRIRLGAKVFDVAAEGIMITDYKLRIISVNRAFTAITGYAAEEISGKSPRVLRSTDEAKSYEMMWVILGETGEWQGEIWNRRKDGEAYPAWLAVSAVKDECGQVTNYVGIFTDITSHKATEERLRYLATHDPLTGVPNRELFGDRLVQALTRAARDNQMVVVMLADLDHFKTINDTFGHAVGDLALQEVSRRLIGRVRDCDTVARLGGDEFTILLVGVADARIPAVCADRILDALAQPFALAGREFPLRASIGISLYPTDGTTAEALLKQADAAMYRAKERRHCWVPFSPLPEPVAS